MYFCLLFLLWVLNQCDQMGQLKTVASALKSQKQTINFFNQAY